MLSLLISLVAVAAAAARPLALQPMFPDAVGALSARTTQWPGGQIHRVEQRIHGLPVHGTDAVIMLDPLGSVRHRRGRMVEAAPTEYRPAVAQDAAKTIAQAALFGRDELWPSRAELVVYVDDKNNARLAWAVDVAHSWPLGIWQVHVDAMNGGVLSTVSTLRSVSGWAFPQSPAFSSEAKVELENLRSHQDLDGWYASSWSCVDWYIELKPFGRRDCLERRRTAKPDVQGNYNALPQYGALDDPFTEVHAYYHTDLVASWAFERYGIDVGGAIDVLTNFPLTNAFYGDFDGDGFRDLSFGISDDGLNLGYDSDIVYHEFGHAIVRHTAGSMYATADTLGIDFTAGSINEGIADIIAMVLNPDPLLGEYMGQSERWDKAIRDLEADRHCPADLQSEVHRDGEIWGSLGWNMIEDPRIGAVLVGDLMVGTLGHIDPAGGWSGAAWALMAAAEDLRHVGVIDEPIVAAIEQHIDALGVFDCGRILTFAPHQLSRHYLINLGLSPPWERSPIGVQFAIPTGADAHALVFQISGFTGEEDGTGWTVHMRASEPVEHEADRIEGLGLHHADAIVFDAVFEGTAEGEVVIDLDSEPALVPGETYYFAVSSKNLTRAPLDVAYSKIVLSAEVHIGEGVKPVQSDAQGCRCSQGGTSWGVWSLWLSACLMALTRRRQG
jgi:hypothetical protein